MPERLAHLLAERFVEFHDRETEIRAELVTYKALLDVVPCPMALMTKDGLAEYVNPAYCHLLVVTLEHVVSMGWHDVVSPDDLERTIKVWNEVVQNRIANFASWSLLKTPHGVIRAYWRSTRLPDGAYAIAVFHPACAFLREESGCECRFQEGSISPPSVA